MRFLLLAATMAFAASPVADWRSARLPAPVQEALRGAGFRLEDDGRVIDPGVGRALSADELQSELLRLNLATQRLALERLSAVLRKADGAGAPPAEAVALKPNLPMDAATALERGAAVVELRSIAERDLATVSAYFDGSRRSPGPVAVPFARRGLSGADAPTRSLSAALASAFEKQLAQDAVGRKILSRLYAEPGRPTLPAISVETLSGDVAQYNFRRGALVLDRQTMISTLTSAAAPAFRAGLRLKLSTTAGLLDYLTTNPQALVAYASHFDAVIAHELTHAWQDRRDSVMRDISDGRLPQALVLDYEVEAWVMKNLYIHSRLKSDPSASIDEWELRDYEEMAARFASWNAALRTDYATAHFNAMTLESVEEIQKDRINRARRAGAANLPELGRAAARLETAEGVQRWRLRRLIKGDVRTLSLEAPAFLAKRYWASALEAPNDVEFAVRKKKAEAYAVEAGDQALLREIRSRLRRTP